MLVKIASKLRASDHGISTDRETLRQRWEVNINMQRQSVTDHLAELIEFFANAQDSIEDALAVIEDKLLA